MPVRFSIYQPMVSAKGDALSKKYRLHQGKSGKRWVVAVQPNEADNIYVEGAPGSDGFGGATLNFDLENGEILSLAGPWKTGADSLLKDTGYDATDKYTTFGVVARERISSVWNKPDFYVGVLHSDQQPVIGLFNRVNDIAQDYANQLNERVVFGVISRGGGQGSWADPKIEQKAE